ncbi:MAG: tetratricopeptide repeat protein [Mariniphaga sp.]|nr:tetratricopeptide repeat protein [Mariniphaga sp.]
MKVLIESAKEDTSKVNLLVKLSTHYRRSSSEEAIRYGIEARDLSKKLNFQKGEANALKYIGMGYYFLGEYVETINYWQLAMEKFESFGDLIGISNMQNNIGAVYFNRGDDNRAVEYYLQSLNVAQQMDDKFRIASALLNIGNVYMNKPLTYKQALDYFLKALSINESLKNNEAIGTTVVNLGELYLRLNQTDSALYYFNRSLELLEQTDGNVPYSLNNIGKAHFKNENFDLAYNYHQQAYERAKLNDAILEMSQAIISMGHVYAEQENYLMARVAYDDARELAQSISARYELKEAFEGLAISYEKLSDYPNAYRFQILFGQIKDTIYNAENEKRITALIQGNEIDQQKVEIELQDLAFQKQRLVKNAFLAGLVFILIIAFITFRNYMNKVKTNRLLDTQKLEIENLLKNILPAKVAKELREDGRATSRYFKNVSVLFTDFKDFTKISSGLSPNELVAELNDFFNAFDNIIEKHYMEKIKTIGDAYMCVGGLPSINKTHAVNAIEAGLEMQEFMISNNKKRIEQGKTPWNLRVGIHTGAVTAGVVGSKKYAYDIWGSAVNTASRMESNGEVGKVNISASTFELVKDKFDCFYRGKILAKNIGEIDMYFVEGEK